MRKPTPLKRAIFDSGRRQKEVAAEVGIAETHLSRIVNGLHADEPTRAAIASAVGKQVSDLWPDVDEQAAA